MDQARYLSLNARTWPAFLRFQLQPADGSFKTRPSEGLSNKYVQKHPGRRPGRDRTLPIPCFEGGSVPDSSTTGRLGFFPEPSQPTFAGSSAGPRCPVFPHDFCKNETAVSFLSLLRRQTRQPLPLTPDVDGVIGTIASSSTSSWTSALWTIVQNRPTRRPSRPAAGFVTRCPSIPSGAGTPVSEREGPQAPSARIRRFLRRREGSGSGRRSRGRADRILHTAASRGEARRDRAVAALTPGSGGDGVVGQ